ncbi:thioredoxin family protein [Pacificibacter sp. AS14]|uniref:thioredoxin family protein n=1 Tax=Pacificibacter sp. AS14 TaxID=3135785 RepID=UPI003176C5B2
MKRRAFIFSAAAFSAASVMGGAAFAAADYTPGLVDQELAAGKTVFLDFKASWCTTCAAQERVMDRLKAANPDYEKSVSFIAVDWDKYGRSELAKRLKIPRRSTLVALKGDAELGRIVAGTREADIKALMDTALHAALA